MRLVALLAVVAACSELPPITEGQCGNGIIEAFEDCDSFDALCVQCRIVCGDDAQCQHGYACGFDDRCSSPGGAFADTPSSTFPFPVLGFRVTDINGDPFGDVVGLAPTSLLTRYGDEAGQLTDQSTVVTPTLQGFPALTHLVSPVVDDLIIPVIDGLVAYTGALGIPSPRQFPLGAEGMGPGGIDPMDAVQVGKTIGMFGRVGDTANARLAFGVLVLDTGSPSFDVVTTTMCNTTYTAGTYGNERTISHAADGGTFVAFEPAPNSVCVLFVKQDSPSTPHTIRSVVALGGFQRSPVFADLDDDGCPSVLDVDAPVNASGNLVLTEYAGVPDTGGCTITSAPTTRTIPLPDPAGSLVLGAVPLEPRVTGLRRDALITSFGIHGFDGASAPMTLYFSDRRVERASIGDLGSDGSMDVVLTTRFPNIDIARRVPGLDTFLLSRQPTTGAVTHTLVADYDGDTRNDLAYIERLGVAERLSISYGTGSGLLPGVPADAFSRVEFMAVMEVPDSTDPFSVVDDLMVIDLEPGATDPEITLLHGSPNRTMLSFYGGAVPTPGTYFGSVVAGHFVTTTGTETQVDLVAVQAWFDETKDSFIHVIPGLPRARLGDALHGAPATSKLGGCKPGAISNEFCLDLAKLIAWPTGLGHEIVLGIDVREPTEDGPTDPPTVMRLDPTDPTLTPHLRNDIFEGGGRIHALERVDLDGDGDFELIAAFNSSELGTGDGYTKICDVALGGTFERCVDVDGDILQQGLECVSVALGNVTPHCETPDQPALDLVVACRSRSTPVQSSIFRVFHDAGAYHAVPVLEADGRYFTDLQLGDVDGDSVDDLVVLDISPGIPALSVFPQLTSRESNVCIGR